MQILQESAVENGPLCVGLDTDPSYLPASVLQAFDSPVEAVVAYNRELIRHIAQEKTAACFKVQIAYYEAMGIAGLKAFCDTLHLVKEYGFPVISDIKRGDISSTADAYARAHFSGDFETDIITVNPYMGFDTLTPFAQWCSPAKGGKGIFVLLRTSNPGMVDIEKQELKQGGIVIDAVGKELNRLAAESRAQYADETCAPIGAVVGCTEESDARMLRDAHPDLFFLIPGYGAQGGAARIAATLLDKAGGVINSSRGILCAWKNDKRLEQSREAGTLCLADIIESALCATRAAKADLLNAKKELGI